MSVASTVPAARLAVAAARLPASPRIFIRLQTALRDPEVSVSQLVELVCVDSALASGVLRVSNSPVFRRGVPVTNLDEAINRIGLREVHRLVGLAMAMQLSQDGLPLYHVSADVLWENTLSVAIAASRLAMNAGEDDRQAYALGLLRSIGRQTLQLIAREDRIAALAEPATSIAALERWEQEVFGLTAMDAAVRLLTGWGFAGAACEPLRSHLCPERCAMRSPLAAILHLAGWVAETLGKGLACERDAWRHTTEIERQAGLPSGSVEACVLDTRGELNRLRALVRVVG